MKGLVFRVEMWAVTRRGNHLVKMLDLQVEDASQAGAESSWSLCQRRQHPAANQTAAEDLSHLSQLVNPPFVSGRLEDVFNVSSVLRLQNSSTGGSVAAECRLTLPASGLLKVTLRGRLHLPALLAVSFRCLEVLTTASIQTEPPSPVFLQEDVAVREVGREASH